MTRSAWMILPRQVNDMAFFLGIDIGTSGTKTILIDSRGSVLAQATGEYGLSHPQPMWSEQNPEDWWQAVVKTVRTVVKKSRIKAAEIRAIGLSGQMHGAVFLDRNDQVVRPAILWNDQRTAEECAEIERRAGGRKRLVSLVANPALTGFTAPKILWLRNHETRNFERTRRVLLPKDEIRRRLTGEYATDVSDASGTLLLDVARRKWSGKLLEKLELDPELLPPVFESEDVTGRLTDAAAKLLGLSSDVIVVGGAGDCAAAALGTGVVKSGILNSSLGTSSVVFAHSDEFRLDPAGRLHTFCHAVRGKWHQMGVTLTGGGALSWFRQTLCPEMRPSAGRSVYQQLEAEAAATAPGSAGLYFLPYLAGERTPHADPNARGCWIGLTLSHSRGHLVRSLMEGVTMAMRDTLEIIRELDVPVREIRATGGGAASPLWLQMQADLFGHRIATIGSSEGPAFGVALLAGVGAGAWSDIVQATTATIKTADTYRPSPATRRCMEPVYNQFRQLYRSLKDDFQAIASLPARS